MTNMNINIIYVVNNIILHHFIIKSNKIWIKTSDTFEETNIKKI